MKKSLSELIRELERELATRRRVYPDWIRQHKLQSHTSEHRIACIEQTIEHMKKLEHLEQASKEIHDAAH